MIGSCKYGCVVRLFSHYLQTHFSLSLLLISNHSAHPSEVFKNQQNVAGTPPESGNHEDMDEWYAQKERKNREESDQNMENFYEYFDRHIAPYGQSFHTCTNTQILQSGLEWSKTIVIHMTHMLQALNHSDGPDPDPRMMKIFMDKKELYESAAVIERARGEEEVVVDWITENKAHNQTRLLKDMSPERILQARKAIKHYNEHIRGDGPKFRETDTDTILGNFLYWCRGQEGTLTNYTIYTKMGNILDGCNLERKRKASIDAGEVFREARTRFEKRAKKAKSSGDEGDASVPFTDDDTKHIIHSMFKWKSKIAGKDLGFDGKMIVCLFVQNHPRVETF